MVAILYTGRLRSSSRTRCSIAETSASGSPAVRTTRFINGRGACNARMIDDRPRGLYQVTVFDAAHDADDLGGIAGLLADPRID